MKYRLFLIILVNTIILLSAPQAFAETQTDALRYTLNEATLKRGYPARSGDGRFTLLIFEGILKGESAEIEIAPFLFSNAVAAYSFRVIQNGQAPLVKKPFTAVVSLKDEFQYARLYYYHAPKNMWLALTSIKDKERGLVFSNRIDFTEGIIGLFGGVSPLADTIRGDEPASSNSVEQPILPQGEQFTALLENDILKNDYTISVADASIVIPEGAISGPSAITGFFYKETNVVDFAIKPFDPTASPIVKGAFIEIIMPIPADTRKEYALAFWDNNAKGFRELKSVYEENGAVKAKTPFHFGKYSVVEKEDVYRGEASWFRDSLLDRTFAAASNDYPKGARLLITNLKNQKSVEVEVRSVGPFVSGRIIDLTKSAFSKIANPKTGIASVRVERIASN